mmetsp:Transcript_124730/g.313648  ORF Transcript_124730/g.313648 Transcript_124730/m.313648 type:complete len:760 (+) Transcript_124730:68-2347(+)
MEGGSCYDIASRVAVAAVFLVLLSAMAADATPESKIMKGISYGPFPSKTTVYGRHVIDDFMSDYAKPLWGQRGRGDLELMQNMGVNTVRMYGNNPEERHGDFLDEAQRLNMKVIPGISFYPYTQSPDDACALPHSTAASNNDCYNVIRTYYKQNLQNGFLQNGAYHPAIDSVIVMNEPELNIGNFANTVHPSYFIKAMLSAIDGMLSAEKDMRVRNPQVRFTVTFSFATCPLCQTPIGVQPNVPGMAQMLELKRGIENPELFGYTPKNDLKSFYATRFYNSFNSKNSAKQLQTMFFNPYAISFPTMDVAVLEFHQPDYGGAQQPVDQAEDLQQMMEMTRNSDQLIGFSFFEWQVRSDKGGTETSFGMFDLGDYRITTLEYYGHTYNVWCLVPVIDRATRQKIPEEITHVYGGEGLNYYSLCLPNASKVSLDSTGFGHIRDNTEDKATFVTRMVQHLGGKVTNEAGLRAFASGVSDFNALKTTLQNRDGTDWAYWDPNAACVADRSAGSAAIGDAVMKACKTGFNCSSIPRDCAGEAHFWENADYVLSGSYPILLAGSLGEGNTYNSDGSYKVNFDDCYYAGSARFAASSYYRPRDTRCVVTTDPSTTTLTDAGYQAIWRQGDPDKLATFFKRVVKEDLHGRVSDKNALREFSASIIANEKNGIGYSMARLKGTELPGKVWVCGGNLANVCHYNPGSPLSGSLSWVPYAFAGMGALICLGVFCTVCYVRLGKSYKGMERRFCGCLPKSCREDSDSDSDSS